MEFLLDGETGDEGQGGEPAKKAVPFVERFAAIPDVIDNLENASLLITKLNYFM